MSAAESPRNGILDPSDRRILRELQRDGRMNNNELAERTGMSTSPCWRRTRRLEEAGIIAGYSANLDRRKIGLGVLVYVSVQIDTHGESDAAAFEKAIIDLDEIVTCHSVGGGSDFVLLVACRDLDAYADFSMTVLRRLPGIKAMTSNFALKEIKAFTGFTIPDK
ncbi:Lrp/AsnC family transcriptional regulator [Sulfitobacter sp. PR48]|uniref:Lrp/AsnC family transcriptional regulator n=1 Tax=Sulfitobacter sp. PR48 TaxID=3028383 RepID=UPI00237B1947|nr:Lrp/AsnC family transcriptional regulator [Sulfitobacter sp. PR48]MDD9722787.1 Lrp/AsnC family transcriptional regulator [Sulfitobacter sp. PR48]